jgi:cytochrome P450
VDRIGTRVDELVTSYAEAHEVLRDRRFAGGVSRPEGRDFLGDSLVVIDGPEHLARRRMYLPLMAEAFLVRLEREVAAPVLAAALDRHLAPGADGYERADLVALLRDVYMRLAAALIGFDAYREEHVSARLYELLGPLSEGATVEWSPRDHDEVRRAGLAAKEAYRREFFAPAWERRQELLARGGELPTDLLALLARNWQPHWDHDLPVRESILFLAGATGNPVGHVVYAVEDLGHWLARHPGDRDRLADEGFLRAAIDETLRLHIPGTPVLMRAALDDVTLHATGRTVAKGTVVGVDMVAANRDPAVFGADADRYDPYRADRLPERVKQYGVAFGGGPHVCLGRSLVLGRSTGVAIDGMQHLVLRALLDAGVEEDPADRPRLAESGQRHYAYYPVRFRARSDDPVPTEVE